MSKSVYYQPYRIYSYRWEFAGGLPDIEYRAFTVAATRSIYSDICKNEQVMADTLQQRRLVALVDGLASTIVKDYTIIEPNPNSVHKVTR